MQFMYCILAVIVYTMQYGNETSQEQTIENRQDRVRRVAGGTGGEGWRYPTNDWIDRGGQL